MTFGAEPKDYEVREFISRHYYHLQYSPAIKTDVKDVKKNPKRAQRDAKKQILEKGIGTKSQQALKLQQEQNKLVRKERSKKHICFFFVDGKYHRQGIGTRLFKAVRQEYPNQTITLNSSPYGVPFYHALGFTDTDKEQTVNGIQFTPMRYGKDMV